MAVGVAKRKTISKIPQILRQAVKPKQNGLKASRVTSAKAKSVKLQPEHLAIQALLGAAHQFGLTERSGKFYDTKFVRLKQLLERLSGRVLIVVPKRQLPVARRAIADASKVSGQQKGNAITTKSYNLEIEVRAAEDSVDGVACGFETLIHYAVPGSAQDYVRYLAPRAHGKTDLALSSPSHIYTMIEDNEITGKTCLSIAAFLKKARMVAQRERNPCKATEILVALNNLHQEKEDDDDDGQPNQQEGTDDNDMDEDDNGWEPPGVHNVFTGQCNVAYHCTAACAPAKASVCIEMVRLPLRALNCLATVSSLIEPKLGHECTIVCCHNLNCLTPWDRWEELFALHKGKAAVRVVQVLADEGSWHDYPDLGTYDQGGCVWLDFIDGKTMLKTDALLERLIDHEIKLLRGRSDRIVLFGKSAGGVQMLLRLLRSRRKLGGFIGGMCHAPTMPHVPRNADPLVACGSSGTKSVRPLNSTRPVRLLCGTADTTFPPALVLRDAQRLRDVGGFSDVQVEVMPGLTHEEVLDKDGVYVDPDAPPPELEFLQKHLADMLS